MGVCLAGEHRDFNLNWTDYRALLELACENGWKPAGVLEPDGSFELEPTSAPSKQHSCGYFTNGGQLVTERDATEIALAIHRYIAILIVEDVGQLSRIKLVRDFAEFCEEGSFVIF